MRLTASSFVGPPGDGGEIMGAAASPAPTRRSRVRRIRRALRSGGPRLIRFVVLPVFLIALWEASVRLGLLNPVFLPSPSRILAAAQQLLVTGELFRNIADSLQRIALANLVAICTAVPLGFFMGLYRPFEEMMDGIVNLIRPIPPLAWIPLAILWFGLGEK